MSNEKTNNNNNEEEHDDTINESSNLVPPVLQTNPVSTSTTPKLRSILRKHNIQEITTNTRSNVQQTLFSVNDNDNDYNERDSDYTGDEDDEEIGEEQGEEDEGEEENNANNHKGQLFQTSSSTSLSLSSETPKLKTDTTINTRNDSLSSSSVRHTCVKFADDKPTVFCPRKSSEGNNSEPRHSITFLNMKESLPITTTMSSDYRPVYVSPLKYRPLLGLSANDSRLLLEKRVSLLGKPVVFHPTQKRSPTYRRTQLHIYNFLERAHGYKALIYHTFVFISVFICLFLSVVVTMPEYEKVATSVLLPSEIIVFIWLSIELSLRVWSAGCRSRYQTVPGRLRFMRKPFCALDLVMMLATLVTFCLNIRTGNGVFAASALRGLRFFQILRMLRMDRRAGTWKLLGSVVYAHRQELITTIYIGFLVLIFSSFIMFLVEKDTNPERNQILINNLTNLMTSNTIANLIDTDRHKFETFADALWWGIITLCTVGYGDKVPSSYLGKLIAAICSFIGISFFALPAGILGSGFALKVQQQQRQKHYKRRKIPAVLLIQNLWRVYAADEKSLSKATWKVHVRPARENTDASLASQNNHNSLSFKMRNNQSFLNRVSFRRRTPSRGTPTRDTPTTSPKSPKINSNTKTTPCATVAAMRSCIDTLSETVSITPPASIILPPEGSSSDNEDDHLYYANDVKSLTAIHRHAIRFTRKVKFFVARRKFREALRPYDVTDVIEQYSTGNVDMLSRMKYIQARLDKVLGTPKSIDSYETGPSLASRICKIEKQVDALDLKIDQLCQLANSVLDLHIRQVSIIRTPSPIAPIIINRIRTGNRFHVHRRRQYPRSRLGISTMTRSVPEQDSSQTNLTHPSTLSIADNSRESLISLYSLLQDNLSSSKTDLV
ncbi:unnamed protein product [Adineta steineri]|uniref:Uncharacterized protein n=1 Tax=Adineta steineri TaxID=433720 RepID=A0A814PHF2_9BILA|nr:unnamed protein product [Adineta steineri]CAF3760794.1 unnamed protein product [Adineta steineri]